jgi:hypothetical protein
VFWFCIRGSVPPLGVGRVTIGVWYETVCACAAVVTHTISAATSPASTALAPAACDLACLTKFMRAPARSL